MTRTTATIHKTNPMRALTHFMSVRESLTGNGHHHHSDGSITRSGVCCETEGDADGPTALVTAPVLYDDEVAGVSCCRERVSDVTRGPCCASWITWRSSPMIETSEGNEPPTGPRRREGGRPSRGPGVSRLPRALSCSSLRRASIV